MRMPRRNPRAIDGMASRSVPPGWTGKLWAVKQGIDAAEADGSFDYLLLIDADIVHERDSVRWLVSHAEAGHLVLTSFMAKLRCQSLAERSHVPAFIFFFQMLFPFSWVNRANNATAAAAGGPPIVAANLPKNSSASLRAVPSISRAPTWAILPPTWASTL